jgi:hypothetical protein
MILEVTIGMNETDRECQAHIYSREDREIKVGVDNKVGLGFWSAVRTRWNNLLCFSKEPQKPENKKTVNIERGILEVVSSSFKASRLRKAMWVSSIWNDWLWRVKLSFFLGDLLGEFGNF